MIEDFGIKINKAKNSTLKKLWSQTDDRTIGINVRSQSEMYRVIKKLDELKLISPTFDYSLDKFDFEVYKEKTVLLNNGHVTSLDLGLRKEDVYSFESLKDMSVKYDTMTKDDLETGTVVRLKNGRLMILFGTFLLSTQEEMIPMDTYNNDLEHIFKQGFNIQQVYNRHGVLVWNRKIKKN